MDSRAGNETIRLDLQTPVWERVFTVAPLVLIGSRDRDGSYDLAPKHMAFQLGWSNYFGFVCTPRHSTYRNIQREKEFTVSYPHPQQVVLASLAAGPRDEDDTKPALRSLPTFAASVVDGIFLRDAYLLLECRLEQTIDGFAENSLITGKILAAHATEEVLRRADQDSGELLHKSPLLAYLYPSRYALVKTGYAFPLPSGFTK